MYQHTKRDIHIFSEPRNQLTATQRNAYFPPSLSIPSFYFPSLLKTPNLADTMTLAGPPRKAPHNHHHSPERGKNRIGLDPQQPVAVTLLLPDPVILDTHPGYPLTSTDGVEFY